MPERFQHLHRRTILSMAVVACALTHLGMGDSIAMAADNKNLPRCFLDISIGGCALMLPAETPPLPPGLEMGGVLLDLDTDTLLEVTLRIQHATSVQGKTNGLRLGCELIRPDAGNLRTLQRYIDQTQKRRRLMSLD